MRGDKLIEMRRTPIAVWLLLALLTVACSPEMSDLTPREAAERLARDLGAQLDGHPILEEIAGSQSVIDPWIAFNEEAGKTGISSLSGNSVEVPLDYWDGTLWVLLSFSDVGDGYCLAVADEWSGSPIAWWVKPSSSTTGSLAGESVCSSIAGG